MRSRNYNEIPRQAIDIQEQIGEGEFGVVYKGQWKSTTGRTQTVALKTLKSTASKDERVKLLQEAATIGQFSHPHIIKLYGVVTITEPVCTHTQTANFNKFNLTFLFSTLYPYR